MAEIFHRIIFEKDIDEPVYYVDEWMRAIAVGLVSASATDEVKPRAKNGDDNSQLRGPHPARAGQARRLRRHHEGQSRGAAPARVPAQGAGRARSAATRASPASSTSRRSTPSPEKDDERALRHHPQDAGRDRQGALRRPSANSTEPGEELKSVQEKAGALGQEAKADMQTLAQEFDTLRQMTQALHRPPGKPFSPPLARVLPRRHQGHRDARERGAQPSPGSSRSTARPSAGPTRAPSTGSCPSSILVPCYGDSGVCWEPFDNHNRATSRGRIAIPMYPKNLDPSP